MSGRIPREFIQDLLQRIDIVDVIDRHLPLKASGANFFTRCPFHQEKSASFSVNRNKQIYHCFGCGVSGNAIGFMMAYLRLEFVEAVEQLAHIAGLTVPREAGSANNYNQQTTAKLQSAYDALATANKFYKQQLRQHPDRQQAIDYLKNRGIDGHIAKDYEIGFAPSGWDNVLKILQQQFDQNTIQQTGLVITKDNGKCYDRFRQRIMFPIYDKRQRVIGFGGRVLDDGEPKYLNSPETPVFHKGREVYGIHQLAKSQNISNIFVVEGYMDVVALAQFQVPNIVATLGTAATKEHIRLLTRYCKTVTFCFDGDNAGRKAAWRALEHALGQLQTGLDCRFMFLPDGEDPDSYVRSHGKDGFLAAAKQAQTLADFFFARLLEEHDITNLATKSALVDNALALVDNIQAEPYKHMLLQQLSQRVRIPVERLENFSSRKQYQDRYQDHCPIATNNKYSHTISANPHNIACALLLQYPALAAELDLAKLHSEINQADNSILSSLLEILANPKHDRNQLNSAQLIEHWRDHADFEKVLQLAQWQYPVPEQGRQTELTDALTKLQQKTQEQTIEALMNRAAAGQLSDAERVKLQDLIRQRKTA